LLSARFVFAQTIINSTFVDRYPEANYDRYSNPGNWMPAEVPNNTPGRQYNVTVGDVPASDVTVDVDATVSNLTVANQSGGFFNVWGKTFTVTGTTLIESEQVAILLWSSPESPGPVTFNAGTLSAFSNHTLSGIFHVGGGGISFTAPATFQFTGADIWTLRGYLSLSGAFSKIVDESGTDALRNLARLDKNSILYLQDNNVVTNAPFFNDGSLGISQYNGSATLTATAGLTNFDPSTRTIAGGAFHLDANGVNPAELRFNGADIVNLACELSLRSNTARITDLTGNDGLRNFASILPAGSLTLYARNLTIPGRFQNDGSVSLFETSTLIVIGGSENFDSATGTLSGGRFALIDYAQLKFANADIVRNGSSITLGDDSAITDLVGNDALRNFANNLASGEFVLDHSFDFTAPGDFTNAGRVETAPYLFRTREVLYPGRFTVAPGFAYIQTAGETVNNGVLTADRIEVQGGVFSGRGTTQGAIVVTNAAIRPATDSRIEGSLTLGSGSHFRWGFTYSNPNVIPGKVTLGGILEIDIPSDRFIASNVVLPVLRSAEPLIGAFSNAPNGARISTLDGKGSVEVRYDTRAIYVTRYHAEPPPAQLMNISSRAFLSRSVDDPVGDRSVLIGGFIVVGSFDSKEVVVRGLGPSLPGFAPNAVLADPVLELRSGNGALLATNDNWADTQGAAISSSGLAPGNPKEAAIRATLVPANYTVVLKEKNGLGGNGVVEVYDISNSAISKLANISTRGITDANNLLIGGMIAGGPGQENAEIVVRALGPSMIYFGVTNAIDDPTLEVRDNNGVIVAFNDDWGSNSEQLTFTALEPLNRESAMRLSLPRGNYTAIVRAKGVTGGVALVEFYDLRQ
jgi:hypothetical protein